MPHHQAAPMPYHHGAQKSYHHGAQKSYHHGAAQKSFHHAAKAPVMHGGGHQRSGFTHKSRSPLILDINHNGKVEAQGGIGVDLNNDGKPDGAAVGGDKMLAMSDLNNNGRIDGAEVFGDLTWCPFNKTPLKAPNGFEALRMIAEMAGKRSGQSLIESDQVNIHNLRQVLEKENVQLGFISDSNDKTLEPIKEPLFISIKYQATQESGVGAHKQKGKFRDNSGTYPVDDVWFLTNSQ
jgi:hypothetical protein